MTDPSFDAWLQDVSRNAKSNEPAAVSESWLSWLRAFFDEHGAVTSDLVRAAAESHQLAVANDAVSAVSADLHSATMLRPVVTVDVHDEFLRIRIDGSWQGVTFDIERADGVATIADYFQEQLDDECWPVCDEHNAGLHAEVHNGVAVWWCRLGAHPVAPIGELGRTG